MNITTDDKHMWLIPFTSGSDHTLTVRFGQPQMIAGFRIWNYNKSPEDSYRGVRVKSFRTGFVQFNRCSHTSCAVCFLQLKVVHVFLDGVCISPLGGFLIRKGPGNCHFDFAQEILFIDYLPSKTSTAAHNRTLTTTSKNTEDTHAHWYSLRVTTLTHILSLVLRDEVVCVCFQGGEPERWVGQYGLWGSIDAMRMYPHSSYTVHYKHQCVSWQSLNILLIHAL